MDDVERLVCRTSFKVSRSVAIHHCYTEANYLLPVVLTDAEALTAFWGSTAGTSLVALFSPQCRKAHKSNTPWRMARSWKSIPRTTGGPPAPALVVQGRSHNKPAPNFHSDSYGNDHHIPDAGLHGRGALYRPDLRPCHLPLHQAYSANPPWRAGCCRFLPLGCWLVSSWFASVTVQLGFCPLQCQAMCPLVLCSWPAEVLSRAPGYLLHCTYSV